LIEKVLYLERLGNLADARGGGLRLVVLQNRVAYSDALVANISSRIIARRRNQFPDDILTFMAKRTAKSVVRSSTLQSELLL
jgi:hypothetical protein